MKKTGESYTTARSRILEKTEGRKRAAAEPRPDYAALAGKRDDVMVEKTGRTWAEWVRELDRHRAHEMAHGDIARLVSGEYGVAMWWTQTVTVGYERIKGLREIGQRRGGGFEASKTKTFAVPLDDVFRMVADARRRGRWWPGVKVETRPSGRPPSARVKHADGTVTQLWFVAKDGDRCTLNVTGTKLRDRAAADAFKREWTERLARLGDLLKR
jgi:hypothetical protein